MDLDCGVCLESKTIDHITFLPCIHFLCSSCYEKLHKNECPFCRNKLRDEQDTDSYDERENEYNDVEFEMLVMEESEKRRKKNKKIHKKVMKIMKNNQELIVSIGRRNTYQILDSLPGE